jgi:hypothetical protein
MKNSGNIIRNLAIQTAGVIIAVFSRDEEHKDHATEQHQ